MLGRFSCSQQARLGRCLSGIASLHTERKNLNQKGVVKFPTDRLQKLQESQNTVRQDICNHRSSAQFSQHIGSYAVQLAALLHVRKLALLPRLCASVARAPDRLLSFRLCLCASSHLMATASVERGTDASAGCFHQGEQLQRGSTASAEANARGGSEERPRRAVASSSRSASGVHSLSAGRVLIVSRTARCGSVLC